MSAVQCLPSLRLRALARIAHAALWLLASAWITLVLAWGGLHFLIVPRIGELRPWLEQQASQRLGVAVRIGAITARSNGLIPSVALNEVRLLDAQGRVALQLPSVLAALSPRSLLGLGFEQLYVEGAVLDVRRSADGRLWIAGLPLPEASSGEPRGADWLFAQTEVAVRHGTLRWTDEARGASPLELGDVDLVLRNRHLGHALRIDADPPAGWGQRLHLMGVFHQPLLSAGAGRWKEWTGQVYVQTDWIDMAAVAAAVHQVSDSSWTQGAGALRAWVDVTRQQLTGATLDLAMQSVQWRASEALEPIVLDRVSGRFAVHAGAGVRSYATQALAFDTQDGLHWPGGNVQLKLSDAQAGAPAHGELQGDRLDLAAARQLATRLPMDARLRSALTQLAPAGVLQQVLVKWSDAAAGAQGARATFSATGRVSELDLAASTYQDYSIPGVRGADIVFDLTQSAGRASVAVRNGALRAPAWFAQPEVALENLDGDVQWSVQDGKLRVDAPRLRFANADAQGEAQLHWQGNDSAAPAPAGQADLGVLDLQGSLSRAEAKAMPRYLPLAVPEEARAYLELAMAGGASNNVHFKVKGPLAQFPFHDANAGDFRITAHLQNAAFAYAPPSLLPANGGVWPALTQVSGDFVLDHDSLSFKDASASVAGFPNVQIARSEVSVTHLYDAPLVTVNGDAHGPLGEALALVNQSPLGIWSGKALAHLVAGGSADYRLHLTLPVGNLEKTTVRGSLTLPGNDVQFAPGLPRVAAVRGTVAFTETGLSVNGLRARALGGEVRVDGAVGLASATPGATGARAAPLQLRVQGTLSADGLRQARELGAVSRLAQYLTGATSYSATVGLRAGEPEFVLNSPLTGLGVDLPAPFAKSAESTLPLHLERVLLRNATSGARAQDQLALDLGTLLGLRYVRELGDADPKVLKGAMGVALRDGESAPLPDSGVVANVHADTLDLDAWAAVAGVVGGTGPGTGTGSGTNAAAGSAGAASALAAMNAYLPTQMALRTEALTLGGRKFTHVLVGGSREGPLWRATVDATEFNGYLEYRPPSGALAGRVYARLARLAIGQSAEQDVEKLLDQQPASIPALDIVVDDFELRGKKLGQLEVQAVNLGLGPVRDAAREWRLNKFNLTTPEASFSSSGSWSNVAATGTPEAATRPLRQRRRTVLNFKLELKDSGELLTRMGMPGVIAKGQGMVDGQVSWLGSPFTLDYPSLGGGFKIEVESGQFLHADPGIAKLLGVLSLQSLPRRLTLDFRDVFSAGFAFDFVRGDVAIAQGIAKTNNLQMKGVQAAVLMEGQADIAQETQQLKVVVIPEINAGSASLIASAINPLVGLTTFLAQVILRRPLIEANTQEFQIDGTWLDPHVTKVEHK